MKHVYSYRNLWFTVPIVILLVIATLSGIFIDELYRDVPSLVAQAKGQDIVSLIVIVPILIITAILARRDSLPAQLIWLGALVYLVYTYASFAFAIKFNPLFLVYVALLGCSLYALIAGLATLDMDTVKGHFTDKTPIRAVSIFLLVLLLLFYILWLSELVPALIDGEVPQSVIEDKTPTNAIHVLDMAWILPAFGITAFSLWRRKSLGYTLAAVLLLFFMFLVSATFSMALVELRNGTQDASLMVMMFGVLLAGAVGMSIWYMRGMRLTIRSGSANQT